MIEEQIKKPATTTPIKPSFAKATEGRSVPAVNKPAPKVMETPPVPVPPVPPKDKPPKKEKKWMLWGLIGFTVILLVTAVFLFLQIRKPESEVLPPVKQTEPEEEVLPPVKQTEPEGVCELTFTVASLICYDECDTNADCDSSLICDEVDGVNRCINYECPEESDCICEEIPITCYDECETNADCDSSLICDDVDGTLRCVNYECPEESDCICPGASPSPRASLPPGASPIARGEQPELPEAGVATPAVLGISVGILLVILGLLF